MKKKGEIKPRPDTVGLYLTAGATSFYQQIMDQLTEMEWDQKYHSNNKAFRFDMPTKYGADIRIHLGWVDADGSMDIKYRTLHNFGLKFNIDFRHFKQDPNNKEVCCQLIRRLADEANYNGRRKAAVLKNRDLDDHEYESWDGEMYRWVDKWDRDYVGKHGEEADLQAALDFLKDIVVKREQGETKARF